MLPLLLTLNRFHTLFWYFHWRLWTSHFPVVVLLRYSPVFLGSGTFLNSNKRLSPDFSSIPRPNTLPKVVYLGPLCNGALTSWFCIISAKLCICIWCVAWCWRSIIVRIFLLSLLPNVFLKLNYYLLLNRSEHIFSCICIKN